MGLGGLITGIMGATGNSPKSDLPNSDVVSNDFNSLMQAYLGQQGNIFQNELQYSPLYNRLSLNNRTNERAQTVSDVGKLSPDINKITRNLNPTGAGLIDTLGNQAQEQLKLNGALDPATQRQVQQSTRSSQAARGLGYGPGDAAQEQFYQTQTMEQRRAGNQAFAGNVASQSQNFYGDPWAKLLNIAPVSATPGLISPQQSDSMLGTSFNARMASNIGNANAQTAMEQGFNSFD